MGACSTKQEVVISRVPKQLMNYGVQFKIRSEYLRHLDEDIVNFLWKYNLICDEKQQPYRRHMSSEYSSLGSECFVVIPIGWENAEMIFDLLGFYDYSFEVVKLDPELQPKYQATQLELDKLKPYQLPFSYQAFLSAYLKVQQ
jgi:hypothetical protein